MFHSTLFALGVIAVSNVRVQAQAYDPSTTDPTKECQPYNFPPITAALNTFPVVWQLANIVPGDTAAQQKFDSIQANIPDIPPKPIPDGTETQTYGADDPDCWWTVSKCTTPKLPGIPLDVFTMPEPRTLGYGFDDGPNCSHNAFYDFLVKEKQTATMFYIGSNAMNWPLQAARAVTDGHEICAHSWSHPYMTSLENEAAFAELYYCLQAIKLATGVTPTCWRPPFGDVDDRVRAIANGLGLRTVLWQYDSQDWQMNVTPNFTRANVDQEYETMISDARNGKFDTVGTIMLMHELNEGTMSVAQSFLPKLRAEFKMVPVATGLNITHPYAERNYTFPTFAEASKTNNKNLATNFTNKTLNSTNSTTSSGLARPSVFPSPVSRLTAGAWTRTTTSSETLRVVVGLALGFGGILALGIIPHY